MSSLHFVSKKDPYAKRWLRLSIDRGIGTHAFQDILPFTKSERETVKKFLSRMDKISCKCSKARRAGQLFKMRATNKLARRRLERTGRKLFSVVSRARAPIACMHGQMCKLRKRSFRRPRLILRHVWSFPLRRMRNIRIMSYLC